MATPTKFGPEFLINTTTLRAQYHPALTALADGRFVCLWTDDSATGADTTGSAVRGQIFNANGSTSGAEFLVNTTTSNDQNDPVLTTLANGRFVAAWTDYSTTGADTSFQAIRAQVFNADGSRFGAEFLVNTRTPGNQSDQSMTALTGGGFVVSWTDFSQIGGDQADTAVRAQVFNANGSKSGAEFQVNTTTAGYQTASHLTALSNGDFVAVWQDSSLTGADTSGDAIRAQIFTADGNMLGAEFLVNTTTLNSQSLPVVTALANGRFVAAWGDLSATGADSSVSAVRAQVFNADGSLSGSEFLVNTTTFSSQLNPSLTALADGRFVAVWTDYSQTGGDLSGTAIRAQVINADGSLSGAEFLVNTATFFYQYNPTLTVLADAA